MAFKLLLRMIFGLVCCAPLQVTADDLSVLEAKAAVEVSRECGKVGDLQCVFENTHAALSSAAYIDYLWQEESHFHLAEWEWYARHAFAAADELAPRDKRDLVELAIKTIKNRPRQLVGIGTTALEVLRAEACIELGDNICARESAQRIALLDARYADQPSHVAGSAKALVGWYTQHSAKAPTDLEFRERIDAVLAILG